jgi:NAD(P)-dependent dehydrogenase (short-subunit alcohol dehydrogenase family)
VFTRIADQYKNCTAVVVGAGGIGGAIIQLLAGSAAHLVVADRDKALLQDLVAACGSTKLDGRKLDVRDGSAVAEFFAFVQATAGTPDYLFYTAGILNIESFAETSNDLWERAVNVNLNGAFYCINSAAELMRTRKRGSILVLGSIAGTKARSGSRVNPVYNATKAGLAAFVNGAAMQLRPYGVRINCISPGPTATSMMAIQPPQVLAAVNDIALDGRMNNPVEVAELALFVAAHGRFTGEDLGMGGGAGLGG